MARHDTESSIAELQAQLDELRAELAHLRRAPDRPVAAPPEATSSRRNLLKLAGATAAGAMASVAVAGRAAAEIGYDSSAGHPQVVADAVNQRQSSSRPGKTAFVFETVNGQGTNDSGYPGALGGWAWDPDAPNGVYGFSSVANGRGVIGEANAAGGAGVVGVYGSGTGSDARGGSFVGSGAQAIGVMAIGSGALSRGVEASAEAYGLAAAATGPAGTGVDASGAAHGVWGRSAGDFGTGVRGLATGPSGYGVFAVGTGYGVVGLSAETAGIGGSFSGFHGAVQVVSGEAAFPSARTRAYERGVIEADTAGNIWYCHEAGTPGKWVKLAGPGTAGTFHAVTPGRVYDSREPLPSPGALANGTTRTISVADRRNTAGGGVATPNFVPAGAKAVTANVTIQTVTGPGVLAVNPGGVATTDASTINWNSAGQVIANGVVLTLNSNRELTVVCFGGGSTHVIVDISGYWL